MARRTTPSFITEIEIDLADGQEKGLLTRLEAARQLYNACLGEALRRMRLMKQSKVYQAACKLPKTVKANKKGDRKPNPERTKAFAEVRKTYSFGEYDLHAYAGQIKQSWIGDHLDINTVQKVATRAFKATMRYALNLNGKPRFKVSTNLTVLKAKITRWALCSKVTILSGKGLSSTWLFPLTIRLFGTGLKHG